MRSNSVIAVSDCDVCQEKITPPPMGKILGDVAEVHGQTSYNPCKIGSGCDGESFTNRPHPQRGYEMVCTPTWSPCVDFKSSIFMG